MRRAAALGAALLLVLGAGPARADPGDPEHGRVIAEQGKVAAGPQGPVPPCRNCHGEAGIGDGSGAFPRLTGQLGFYTYKQLEDFAAGTRPSPVMSPIAQALSRTDWQDLAAYFAAAKGPLFPLPTQDPERVQRGGQISAAGLPDRHVPACIACHGNAGAGMEPAFPYLGGQYASYMEFALAQFRTGRRHNSPLDVMTVIARQLDDDESRVVSEYLAAVRPPLDCGDAGQVGSGAGPAAPPQPMPLPGSRGP